LSTTNQPHVGEPARTEVFGCRDARLTIRSDHRLTTITITGEIYASNADDISRRVRALVPRVGALIVDLSRIDFIGIAGLRVLFSLNNECARTNTAWALIAGHSAARLLRIGDPDDTLPTVASSIEALRRVRSAGPAGRRLQLVAAPNGPT
jgi:anti-anti-sigma factor